jgi:uncharacterized phage protein (TIGR01671 family)
MKREIKFRAWDESKEIMHFDFQFIKSGDNNNDWIVFISDKQTLQVELHPLKNPYFQQQFKIMQFTGLKDSEENDIYEGDIIQTVGYTGVVKYEPQAAQYHINWKVNDSSRYMTFNVTFSDGEIYQCNYMKVIGNIYENPELL